MSADQPREDKRQKYTPFGLQANAIGKLFKNPDKPVSLPEPSKEKTIKPPPDIVKNVSSSTAGAGSGEFHVYKQARQREYERLSIMAERAEKVGPSSHPGNRAGRVCCKAGAGARRGRAKNVEKPRTPRKKKGRTAACQRNRNRAEQKASARRARRAYPAHRYPTPPIVLI